ncbi:MAG TPA: hypothetical protein PKY12_04430, partial [Catalimonadaceae bacterium]|nr:hypothetical protein [Catalimonadaceae bacterium]
MREDISELVNPLSQILSNFISNTRCIVSEQLYWNFQEIFADFQLLEFWHRFLQIKEKSKIDYL